MKTPHACICIDDNFKLGQSLKVVDARAETPFLSGEKHQLVIQNIEYLESYNNIIGYAKPNIISILIDNANLQFVQSKEKAIKVFEQSKLPRPNSFSKLKEDTLLVYEYISSKTNSIINAYQGIEAFCNISVPDNYTRTEKKSKCTELYNKQQIERHFSTSKKLSIICEIFGIKDIKLTKYWEDYIALESVRNDLVHQKSSERKGLIKKLFQSYNINHSEIAEMTISYIVYEVIHKIKNEKLNFKNFDILEKWPQLKGVELFAPKKITQFFPFDERVVKDLELYK